MIQFGSTRSGTGTHCDVWIFSMNIVHNQQSTRRCWTNFCDDNKGTRYASFHPRERVPPPNQTIQEKHVVAITCVSTKPTRADVKVPVSICTPNFYTPNVTFFLNGMVPTMSCHSDYTERFIVPCSIIIIIIIIHDLSGIIEIATTLLDETCEQPLPPRSTTISSLDRRRITWWC
jgi:hypothetical protein